MTAGLVRTGLYWAQLKTSVVRYFKGSLSPRTSFTQTCAQTLTSVHRLLFATETARAWERGSVTPGEQSQRVPCKEVTPSLAASPQQKPTTGHGDAAWSLGGIKSANCSSQNRNTEAPGFTFWFMQEGKRLLWPLLPRTFPFPAALALNAALLSWQQQLFRQLQVLLTPVRGGDRSSARLPLPPSKGPPDRGRCTGS